MSKRVQNIKTIENNNTVFSSLLFCLGPCTILHCEGYYFPVENNNIIFLPYHFVQGLVIDHSIYLNNLQKTDEIIVDKTAIIFGLRQTWGAQRKTTYTHRLKCQKSNGVFSDSHMKQLYEMQNDSHYAECIIFWHKHNKICRNFGQFCISPECQIWLRQNLEMQNNNLHN